jgi:hypothetical protein
MDAIVWMKAKNAAAVIILQGVKNVWVVKNAMIATSATTVKAAKIVQGAATVTHAKRAQD